VLGLWMWHDVQLVSRVPPPAEIADKAKDAAKAGGDSTSAPVDAAGPPDEKKDA
jgi:hypothetical protein